MEHDLVKVLMNPDGFYPWNFSTAKRANAMLSCLCQEAAEEITHLRQQVATLTEQRDMAVEALKTFIDEHEECTDAGDWMAFMCSPESLHMAEEALAAIQSREVTK